MTTTIFSSPLGLSGGATLNKDTSILAKSFDIKLLKRELNNSLSLLLRFKSVLTQSCLWQELEVVDRELELGPGPGAVTWTWHWGMGLVAEALALLFLG